MGAANPTRAQVRTARLALGLTLLAALVIFIVYSQIEWYKR